jgi:hypothetical protein
MLSLIVLLGFPFLIWQAYRKVRLSRESATWPQVRGIITASERVKAMWRVQPRVSYGYEVDGKTYASSRVTFADAVPASETEPILARYLLHQAVAVSYQPGHPEVAVLEPGPNRAVSLGLRAFIIWYGIIILLNVADIGITLWTSGPDAGTSTAPTYDDVAKADPQLGNKLLRQDAENGNAQDQVYVAMWYLGGTEGYPKDPAEAVKWLRKAADQGNAEGESWLGQLYAKGVGVDKDLVQAVAWMRKAADQGEPHACASLGYAYEKGVGGLPQDKEQAIEWYRKAGDEPHAKKALARLQAGG